MQSTAWYFLPDSLTISHPVSCRRVNSARWLMIGLQIQIDNNIKVDSPGSSSSSQSICPEADAVKSASNTPNTADSRKINANRKFIVVVVAKCVRVFYCRLPLPLVLLKLSSGMLKCGDDSNLFVYICFLFFFQLFQFISGLVFIFRGLFGAKFHWARFNFIP